LVVLELLTAGFFSLFFAVGALVAACVAWVFPDDFNLQLWVFLLSSVGCFIIGRPALKNMFGVGDKPPVPSNVDALIGQEVLALEPVTRIHGRVKVLHTGEVWSAILDGAEGDNALPPDSAGI